MYDLAEQAQLSLLLMWTLVPLLLGDPDRGSIERVSYGGFRVISRAGPLMEFCRLRRGESSARATGSIVQQLSLDLDYPAPLGQDHPTCHPAQGGGRDGKMKQPGSQGGGGGKRVLSLSWPLQAS